MIHTFQFPVRRFGNGEFKTYRFKRSRLKGNELTRYLYEADMIGDDDFLGVRGESMSKSPQRLLNDDQKLARDIRNAINEEDSIPDDERASIDVQVDEGIVTISGIVSSKEEKDTIAQRVEALTGSEKFVNQLSVASR
ncbi:MAG: BON domain-containing protein [Candidatus Omnitrophica bacterium]|nr:BON domain-containing protein [Candidatus Omnitrophota bacterium]